MGIVYWVDRRERSWNWVFCNAEFHYPKGIEQFEDQLEPFKARSTTEKVNDDICLSDEEDIVNSGFGEKANHDRLIVLHEVSDLAEE